MQPPFARQKEQASFWSSLTLPNLGPRLLRKLVPEPSLGHNKEKSPTFVRLFSWLRDQDSNLGPHGYEPCELPLLHPATTEGMRQT